MRDSQQKRILLVEDEALIALAQQRKLEQYGYQVVVANCGERALEMVTTNPHIDLILMDINLGEGLDGTETAERILKYREIPVVFLSSHTDPDIVERTEHITSYGYVVKQSGITVLDASMKMAFKLYASRLQEQATAHALKAREDFLNCIYHENEVAIFVVKVNGPGDYVFEHENKLHAELFGVAEEMMGKTPRDLEPYYGKEAVEYIYAIYNECTETGQIHRSDFVLELHGEIHRWYSTVKPLVDGDGKVYRLIGSSIDITSLFEP